MDLGRILPEGSRAGGVLDLTPHCRSLGWKTRVEGLLDAESLGRSSPTPGPWGTFRRSLGPHGAAILSVL